MIMVMEMVMEMAMGVMGVMSNWVRWRRIHRPSQRLHAENSYGHRKMSSMPCTISRMLLTGS